MRSVSYSLHLEKKYEKSAVSSYCKFLTFALPHLMETDKSKLHHLINI